MPGGSTYSVGVGEVPRVGQPGGEVVVGGAPRHVVHQQRAGRPAVVGPGHRPEPLLARRVPDLQLDLLSRHLIRRGMAAGRAID